MVPFAQDNMPELSPLNLQHQHMQPPLLHLPHQPVCQSTNLHHLAIHNKGTPLRPMDILRGILHLHQVSPLLEAGILDSSRVVYRLHLYEWALGSSENKVETTEGSLLKVGYIKMHVMSSDGHCCCYTNIEFMMGMGH